MTTSTTGIKLDESTKQRIKAAAAALDRTPHWLMKHAIATFLAKVEAGATLEELVEPRLLASDTEKNSVMLRRRINEGV